MPSLSPVFATLAGKHGGWGCTLPSPNRRRLFLTIRDLLLIWRSGETISSLFNTFCTLCAKTPGPTFRGASTNPLTPPRPLVPLRHRAQSARIKPVAFGARETSPLSPVSKPVRADIGFGGRRTPHPVASRFPSRDRTRKEGLGSSLSLGAFPHRTFQR